MGERSRKACIMFTDGSFIPNIGGGAAVTTRELTAAHAFGPAEGISNYKMETMAIMMSLSQFKQLSDKYPNRYQQI